MLMKTRILKTVSLITAVILFMSSLASCTDDGGAGNEPISETDFTVTREFLENMSQKCDYDGEKVTIITNNDHFNYKGNEEISSGQREIYAGLGDTLGVTVDLMLCNSEAYESTGEHITELVKQSVMSNSHEYDLICGNVVTCGKELLMNGCLSFIADEYLELENSWWNQSINDNMMIDGRSYLYNSKANISYYHNVPCIAYNHKLGTASQSTLFDIVENGQWTLDKMNELSIEANIPDGSYAYVSDDDLIGSLFFASAGKTLTYSGNGIPVFETSLSKENEDFIEILSEIFGNGNMLCLYNIPEEYEKSKSEYLSSVIDDGKVLYVADSFSSLGRLGVQDSGYTLLPMPKENEKQKDYISMQNPLGAFVLCFPRDVDDIVLACRTADVFSAESELILEDVFYSEFISDDSEFPDREKNIYNILLNGSTFNLEFTFGWGDVSQALCKKCTGNGNISNYDIIAKLANTEISQVINTIKTLYY